MFFFIFVYSKVQKTSECGALSTKWDNCVIHTHYQISEILIEDGAKVVRARD